MREAAEYFIGEHDFKSFCSNKRMKKSTVRRLYDIEIKADADEIRLYFHGDGFLYNMARAMSGTVVYAAEGKFPPKAVTEILENKNRTAAGPTMPPGGLYMTKLWYECEEVSFHVG